MTQLFLGPDQLLHATECIKHPFFIKFLCLFSFFTPSQQQQITYFIIKVDIKMSLLLVFEAKKSEKDTNISNFLQGTETHFWKHKNHRECKHCRDDSSASFDGKFIRSSSWGNYWKKSLKNLKNSLKR